MKPKPSPAIELTPSLLRLGPYRVPRYGVDSRATARLESMSHMTIDQPTLDLLSFLLISVETATPCLLEGRAAVSKSSAIAFLADLKGCGCQRISMNGQITAADLLGRFVPNPQGLTVTPRELLGDRAILDPKAIAWLESKDPYVPLSSIGARLFAGLSGWIPSQWTFQEGPIPSAMRAGGWVNLEEINLSDAQEVESVNSVLENPPTLYVPDEDIAFGPGGDVPVDPGFRMFATMNPVGYAGRSALSPAFRNRWLTKAVPSPGEAEFRQMLLANVFGEQPVVVYEGEEYQGIAPALSKKPPHAALASHSDMRDLLERIATFHSEVVNTVDPPNQQRPALSSGRRERYTFTRRDLVTFLQRLSFYLRFEANLQSTVARTLDDVYLSRLEPGDRELMSSLLLKYDLGRLTN